MSATGRFSLERDVPADMLRSIDRFVDLTNIREHLKLFLQQARPPLIAPELMFRMLIIGYCMGIRPSCSWQPPPDANFDVFNPIGRKRAFPSGAQDLGGAFSQ